MSIRMEQKRKERAQRRAQKRVEMTRPGAKSKYARKRAWLNSHTRTETLPDGTEVSRQLWGFEVPPPKPWRVS